MVVLQLLIHRPEWGQMSQCVFLINKVQPLHTPSGHRVIEQVMCVNMDRKKKKVKKIKPAKRDNLYFIPKTSRSAKNGIMQKELTLSPKAEGRSSLFNGYSTMYSLHGPLEHWRYTTSTVHTS